MKGIIKILIAVLLVISVTAAFVDASENENKPVIIGFKDKPTQADKDQILGHGGKIKYSYNIINAIAADLPDKAIEAFKKNPKVNYVEADGVVHALEQTVPWGIIQVKAPLVHPHNKGTGVKVAIIDTGIDYNHPDLIANYNGGWNFISNNNNPWDDNGHGTHVAGTVTAVDNTDGVIGVAPEVDLYALKVLNSAGSGTWSGVAAAIDWAATNHMQIASMSLGGAVGSLTVESAVNNAYNFHNVLIVAAAGNEGNSAGTTDTVGYPARYENVIAVGATDNSNNRAYFSSTGPKVELAAPGYYIYSTYPGGSFATMSGTSMATPHVTGVAALVFNSDETAWVSRGYTNGDGIWTNGEVRTVLDNTATDLGATARDTWYGYGLVDAFAAVPPADSIPPAPQMHISAIGMLKTKYGKFTYASAIVTVVNEAGLPVSGATVYGGWSGAITQTNSGVTGSNGQVTIQSRTVKNAATTFTFTVTNVVKSGQVYDVNANVETSDTI